MLKKFARFFPTDRTKDHQGFDPSRFGDPIAVQTAWSLTNKAGPVNRGFKPVMVHSGRMEFRPSLGTRLMYLVIFTTGAGLAAASLTVTSGDAVVILQALVGLCIACAAFSMLYHCSTSIVFDKRLGYFRKGRKAPGNVLSASPVQPRNHARIEDIHALQIIAGYRRGSNVTYLTHELNLVFKDGERAHLVDGVNLKTIRKDVRTLAMFLEKPVWDATDTKGP